jgi:hypothetical protein
MPSRLKSASAAPRPRCVVEDAGLVGRLFERPVGLAEEQVVRVLLGEVRLGADVALGDEQVDEAVVVDVLELGVPGGRGQHVAAGERLGRGDAALEGDVAIRRLTGPGVRVWSLLSPWLVM